MTPTRLNQLRRYRLKNDLTYAELGQKIGVSEGQAWKIINGVSDVHERTVYKIDDLLRRKLDGKQCSGTVPETQQAARHSFSTWKSRE